ncbi:PAS domain S-box protein [Candidatus Poribacteria bacterium]
MRDKDRTKEQLIDELAKLRRRIVELEAVETALRRSEGKHRDLVELAPDGIMTMNNLGMITSINRAFTVLTGFEEDEIVGKHFTKIGTMRGIPVTRYARMLSDIIRGKRSGPMEFSFVRKDGTVGIGEAHISPLVEDGKHIGIQGILRDITERKREAEALRESEEKYRQLFSTVSDAIMVFDAVTYQFIDVNRSCESLYGYSKKEFLDLKVTDISTEVEDTEGTIDKILEGKLDRIPVRYHRKKDGTVFPVEISAGSFILGGRRALCGIVRDITERKQAEELLRRSEGRFRELTDLLPQTVFETDVNGNLTFVNRHGFDSTGYTQEDFDREMSALQLLISKDRDRAGENVRRILSGEKPGGVEYTALKKDGSTYPIIVYASLTSHDSIPVGLRGIVVDITERKKMEEELLKMEKLESIGVLAGGIAHDLNNLLTGVVGNISLARMYADPSERDRRLAEADKASMRIKDLTQQLLTFSKGGAPIVETASIAELLRDSAKFVLRGSNVRCEFSIPDDLWSVEIDKGQMNQVINNIVINANQAMASGGTVEVGVENMTIEAEDGLPLRDGKYVKISIEDHGIGIPEADLPKIFDPFYTTKQEGNGLGLATSYSIVDKHNGYITAESELGVGTTFHIYIPASPGQILAEEQKIEDVPTTGEGRVLVMDDEEQIRDLAAGMLNSLEYEVATAEDGAKAIELYKNAESSGVPFDAVILDLTVPGGMGGSAAIQELRIGDQTIYPFGTAL